MTDELKEEIKEEKEEEKKGVFAKIKDKILPDQEEQAAIISTFVRLGVLVWSTENRSDIYSFSFYRRSG